MNLNNGDFTSAVRVEQRLITLSIILAIAALSCGVYLAYAYSQAEWVNRSGAAITALEALIAISESKRRGRFQRMLYRMKLRWDYLADEMEKAEGSSLMIAVSLAACGELIHGFGDLAVIFLSPEHFTSHHS